MAWIVATRRLCVVRALLCMLVLSTAASCQQKSQISDHLTYNTASFVAHLSIPYNHDIELSLFEMQASVDSADRSGYRLAIIAPKELVTVGNFKARLANSSSAEVLGFTAQEPPNQAVVQYVHEGSPEALNKLLHSLTFFRNKQLERDSDFEVIYRLYRQSNSGLFDSFSQKLQAFRRIKLEQLEQNTSISIYKGERFTRDLLVVTDNKAIFGQLSVRLHPSSSKASFYTVNYTNGLVWVEGGLSDDGKDPELDSRDPYRVSFSVRDTVTGVDSESFTYYLQVEKEGLDQAQKVKLAVLSLLLFIMILVLFSCIVGAIKKDKKQQKEQVKKQMQEAAVQENVLTKSIVEWNKEMTSTRDQSHKDSVLFNPYEKYSLKKKAGNRSRADQNYQSMTSSLNTVSADRSNRQLNSTKSRATQQLERLTGLKKEMFEADGQARNNSKLEFSKMDDMNQDNDAKMREIEFGDDLSKIEGEGQLADDEQPPKRESEPQLEDIILKGL